MREDFAEVTYAADGRSQLKCPCGTVRPEFFYQSDKDGNRLGVYDRTCAIITCSACGRVMTVDGAVIGQREGADA